MIEQLIKLGLTEEELEGWKIEVAKRNGQDCALVVSRGTEIHFASLGGPAMTRKNTLEFLKPIFDEWGFVTTRVPINETDHKLRTTLGFKRQWQDARFSYWCMTELPFQKRQKNASQ